MPIPTLFSASPNKGIAGDVITIDGQYLTGATAVLFDTTPAASFIVVDDFTITAVVPHTSATTHNFTVTTPSGSRTDINGFRILFPGPWVQPADTWQTETPHGAFYEDVETSLTQPDPAGTVAGSNRSSFFEGGLGVTGVTNFAGEHVNWQWDQRVSVAAIDLTTDVDDDGLNRVNPPSTVFDDPHVVDYVFEAPAGAALGPVKIVIGVAQTNGEWLDDTNGKTANPADPIFASRIRLARLAAADYSYTLATNRVRLAPDTFPTRAFLAALTPLVDLPIARTSADMTVASRPPGGGFVDNDVTATYEDGALELDLDLTDLDGDRRFAVIFWLDRIAAGDFTAPAPSGLTFVNGPTYTATGSWPSTNGLTIQVKYRPPRWRLRYDRPLSFPSVRQRQIPGAVRQRQMGSVVRQRQIPR